MFCEILLLSGHRPSRHPHDEGQGSRTSLKRAKGASDNHHRLFGSWGSRSCQPVRWRSRVPGPLSSSFVRKEPPRVTFESPGTVTHSAALPSRSCNPRASGARVATAWVLPSEFSACQLLVPWESLPAGKASAAACFHSASVGSRYCLPVTSDSHSQKDSAALRVTLITGKPACPQP